jgi:hypothetical protein
VIDTVVSDRRTHPPNPPRSASQPGLLVALHRGLMASTRASPASISTPAPRYVSTCSAEKESVKRSIRTHLIS